MRRKVRLVCHAGHRIAPISESLLDAREEGLREHQVGEMPYQKGGETDGFT